MRIWFFCMVENKISSELSLALELPENIRAKSLDLNAGYQSQLDEWELIIRYTGDLTALQEELGIFVEELYGGYGIARIPQKLIGRLSEYKQIDYIEKPKDLLFEQQFAIEKSCVSSVWNPPLSLTGKGILISCIDSGVDLFHESFQKADKTTKIKVLWDQTIPGNPPNGFYLGSVYEQEDINRILQRKDFASRKDIPFDTTGHGTAVLGVLEQMAPEAEFIVVKMGNAVERGFPRTTQFMAAVEFSLRYAIEQEMPLVINISYGNNYGAHNGTSIFEQYLEQVAKSYKIAIVAGTGNDGLSGRYYSTYINGETELVVPIYVSNYLKSFHLQIWKAQMDEIDIYVEAPSGRRFGPITSYTDIVRFSGETEEIAVWYGDITPYNSMNEIYMAWIPYYQYISAGIWNIRIRGRGRQMKRVEMWLPVSGSTSAEVFFVQASNENTLVVPASTDSVISVGAYNVANDTYAAFSGQRIDDIHSIKPNIVAPGVNVASAMNGGGYGLFTGTSFAAPFVSGASALLMEWGIVRGNDPYLYGEKLKGRLVQGARKLPIQKSGSYLNAQWGALCVSESLIPK